jgi:mannose/cellobiose epimerase-like protein (N-acyl-D-glucosamine 2-epimerase family)
MRGDGSPDEVAVARRVDAARAWMFERALPFWGREGVDGGFGFAEHLTLDARRADVPYKRLRVQARQVYVFSHASLLGYDEGVATAERGWRFVLEHAWLEDGGWASRLGREGGITDPTLDLYDQAFALHAIAWWVRATGDEDALAWVDRTLDAVDRRLANPSGPGWLSDDGGEGELRQNPHMHLLESLLVLHEVSGDDRVRDLASHILELFATVFFDPATGTLAEYFERSGERAHGERGRIVEPGHHFEWVWLLRRAAALFPGADEHAEALFAFAERHGVDPRTGLVHDEVRDDGSLLKGSSRSWTNTEALKAHLARSEENGELDVDRTVQTVDTLFRHFLDPAPVPGTWIDHVDADARPRVDKIPASTLYHVFLAFAELMRVAPGSTR